MAAPFTWQATGSMATARQFATATLLADGKVLVAGGEQFSNGYLSSAELYDPATGTWSATGSMATARRYATATLLRNGKVLVVGGANNLVLNSAELYDPATGTWSATGSLATGRSRATATLLPSGKVLVAGGGGSNSSSPVSAELYDPANGTWSTTGSMAAGRDLTTATLLPSGKVLVAGGWTFNDGYLTSAELYDPAIGTWTATGSLAAARRDAAATLLPNGKVLVAGGGTNGGFLTSAELYDPAGNGGAGSWSTTGSMPIAHGNPMATLLPNGKVLVFGGAGTDPSVRGSAELFDPSGNGGVGSWTATNRSGTDRSWATATLLPNGKVLVAGGVFFTTEKTAELFDPASGSWSGTGSLATGRHFATATLLPDGTVLVAGGLGATFGGFASAELYSPNTGLWFATGNMTHARYNATATLLPNGKVLVAGGYGDSVHLASAELYNPSTGSWQATGSMATPHRYATATLLASGKVLVAAGETTNFVAQATAELYNPATGQWSPAGSLATARRIATATLLPNGKVLVAGGYGGPRLASAELYDPATGTWSATGSLATPRSQATANLLPTGKVLVAGGRDDAANLASAELYDPAGNNGVGSWSATGSLVGARTDATATLLPNGQVLVAGGYNNGIQASAQSYDPASGTWSATGSLATGRYYATATLLRNGKVLAAGGDNGNSLTSAELYDVGLGFNSAWQPQIATATSPLAPGSKLVLTGSRFQGISEASSGGYQDSSSNYPIVQLRRLDNEQVKYLLVDPAIGWSDTGFTSTALSGFLGGPALVTVFTNGIPSAAVYVANTSASPTMTTQASSPTVAGGSISDTATIAAGYIPTGTITFKVYGPDDATCGGAAVFTSVKTVSGNGNYTSDAYTVSAPGTYRFTATYSGDTNNIPVAAVCNDANESVVVSKAIPTVATQASSATIVGGNISDTATLAVGYNPTGTITFNVYGPNDATCGSAAVFTSAKTVSGNGNYISDPYPPAAPGTYRFTASYSGDTANTAVGAVCNAANESVVVNKASPTITTQASSATVVGGSISDTATIAAGYNPNGTLNFSVYGPNDATCGNAAVFTSTKSVSGNGDYMSDAYTPPTPGTYRFTVGYVGDTNNAAVAAVCNAANESVVVNKASPTLTTQASGATAVGGIISDSGTIAAGYNPSGTLTFQAYGPDDASCGSAPAFTSQVTVNGNNSYGSGPFSPTLPGTYRFVASYSGDTRNNSVSNACGDANESVVVSPGTTLGNLSTRLRVETGDNALIGGFIITGTQPKKVIIRGIGPSLPIEGRLEDPTLELRNSNALVDSNDNWVNSKDKQAIIDTGVAPTNDLESAIIATLPASGSSYTAIVRGVNNATGIGVVEAYDLDRSVDSKLANISTRGFVGTDPNILIAGTIVLGSSPQRVIVRAIGPSLSVPGKLDDPTLELRDSNGGLVRSNDDWRSDQEAEIIATQVPPTNDKESAIVATLPANNASYTAIVRGVGGSTGIAVVEIYALAP